MGACSSCLGLGRRRDVVENPETSRLLDDPYRSHYGSIGQQTQKIKDPETERQNRERMEGICHVLSDNVIDTLTIRSGGGVGQSGEQSEESSDTQSAAHTQASLKSQPVGIETQKPEQQEMTYKSVKKTRSGSRRKSPFNKAAGGWEAAKAIMG